jgi:MFS family permease
MGALRLLLRWGWAFFSPASCQRGCSGGFTAAIQLEAPEQSLMKGTFRSLQGFNYRLWAGGAIVSNIGTWMQRVAQDWLVLTQLTHRNATAVGIVMGLQFGPQLLLLPLTGFAADHLDRRKLLIATQAAMGLLALVLGVLTITGVVQLWHVYVFAFLLGCVSAIDAPARQTFVTELVDEAHLSNAVALNSTSFNVARMIGPAIAGVLIAGVGCGWVFLINAVSFAAVLCSLALLRVDELHTTERAHATRGSLAEGFRYVWQRPDLKATFLMLFLICTFGVNFPIFIATMSVSVFHAGASQYGLLSSVAALGSIAGALLSATREKPHVTLLFSSAAVFGFGLALAAIMPNVGLFSLALVVIGLAGQTFSTTSLATVQVSTEPAMRGRVMAILLALALGGTPIGAPIVGWVADTFGPRWALALGAASGFAAALVGLRYLMKHRGLRVHIDARRMQLRFDEQYPVDEAP